MRINERLRISPQVWTSLAALLILGLASHIVAAQSVKPPTPDMFSGHPRVAFISDIGGDPDDQMSLVRLLVYSNELDIEAMIAATSNHHRTVIHPEITEQEVLNRMAFACIAWKRACALSSSVKIPML